MIDLDGVYDPCRPNDRLLLGMKGSISEFELSVLRTRMLEAARAKARRGELRISVPIGYLWHRETGLGLDPNLRLQEVIRLIFARFRELGSARQVLLSLRAEQIHFPRPSDGRTLTAFDWTPIRYRNVKSGRGGRALLAGLLACGRCGRRLSVAYTGRAPGRPVYRCDRFDLPPRCMSFGGARVDAAIARELLRAVEPMAIETALHAEQMHMDTLNEQRRIIELELQHAQYEATLAERRYAACDPDNRLIAAQLEKNWEAALHRVQVCQARLDKQHAPSSNIASTPDFTRLAEDLEAAWNAPGVTMRARQQLVRALITDIIVDVDEATREVMLTIHWQGGQHSQLRVRKPQTGEHGCRTPDEALAVIRSMATRWSDQDIAASLNRMGMRTGQGKTWTAHRVSSLRRVHDLHAYRSAQKNGDWLTMSEAAKLLGVTNHVIRRLIKDQILAAEQVVPEAPYQIRASDLQTEAVTTALTRKHRPCRNEIEGQLPMFTEASKGGAQ